MSLVLVLMPQKMKAIFTFKFYLKASILERNLSFRCSSSILSTKIYITYLLNTLSYFYFETSFFNTDMLRASDSSDMHCELFEYPKSFLSWVHKILTKLCFFSPSIALILAYGNLDFINKFSTKVVFPQPRGPSNSNEEWDIIRLSISF